MIKINVLYQVFLKNYLNKTKFSDSEEKVVSTVIDRLRFVHDWSNYYTHMSENYNTRTYNYGFPSKAKKKSNTHCVSSIVPSGGSMRNDDMETFSSYLKDFVLLAYDVFSSKFSLSNFLGDNGILVFLKTPCVGITKTTTPMYNVTIADGVTLDIPREGTSMLVTFNPSEVSVGNITGKYVVKPLENCPELSRIASADFGEYKNCVLVLPSQTFGRKPDDQKFAFLIFSTGKPLAYRVRVTDKWDMECEEYSNYAKNECNRGNYSVNDALWQGYNYLVDIAAEDGYDTLTYYLSFNDFVTLADIESGLNPCAFPNTGEKSFGLFQIYLPTFERLIRNNKRAQEFGNIQPKDLFNPVINAKFAAILMLENYKTLCSWGIFNCTQKNQSLKTKVVSALFCAWNSGVGWVKNSRFVSDEFVYCCHSKKLCDRNGLPSKCRDDKAISKSFDDACRVVMDAIAKEWGTGGISRG